MPTSRLRLRWSERTGRYTNARGRFVTAAAVRADLDRALEESGRTIQRLAGQLQRREIDLISWELAMRQEVKAVQLYSAAMAKGGVAQLSSADLGRIGASVKRTYDRLDAFARQIEAGLPLDGRFAMRTRMYAAEGRSVYEATRRREQERRGFTEARSVLHPADHCQVCVDEAAAGFRPAEDVIPIGSRTCLTNCRCTMQYRHPETGDVSAA